MLGWITTRLTRQLVGGFDITQERGVRQGGPPDKRHCAPASCARVGHPRTVEKCPAKMSSKGRIELQVGVSGAEIREEPAGDVRFCVALQKPIKNSEKLIVRPIFPKFSERV